MQLPAFPAPEAGDGNWRRIFIPPVVTFDELAVVFSIILDFKCGFPRKEEGAPGENRAVGKRSLVWYVSFCGHSLPVVSNGLRRMV